MTLEGFAAVGEIITSVATVATLAYLALQIRTANRVEMVQSRRAVHERTGSIATALGTDKQSASVFRRGLADFSALDEDEQIQFVWLFSQLVGHVDLAYADERLGLAEKGYMEGTSQGTFNMMMTPGGRAYWEMNKNAYSPEFREFVERRVYGEG